MSTSPASTPKPSPRSRPPPVTTAPKRSATAQARAYATWVTRPPGWQATHPDPDKAPLRLGEDRFGEDPDTGWTPPPMTPRQAGYLADLSRRAGVAPDGGLNVAEASERIAALIAAEGHPPERVPGRQHQRSATFDPYLDQHNKAEEAVTAAERASDDLRRPSERVRSPEEIMRSERLRTPEEIMRSEAIRSPEEIMRSERIRSERIRSPAEIRVEEEGRSIEQDQDASRASRRDLEHGLRRERSRGPWSLGH